MSIKNYFKPFLVLLSLSMVATHPTIASESNTAFSTQEKKLKLKIAIGRFSNETNYGKSLLRDTNNDPLGKQASDIFASMLTNSGRFLVFERPDISKIQKEKGSDKGLVGVDTLILGSIVEFGRKTSGKRGLFNRKKQQLAHAKVTLRLVDIKTGLVFHSATGSGEAVLDSKTVLGVGSTADYDATLNDKAISAAISSMMTDLVSKFKNRKWKSTVIHSENGSIFISGGKAQGLSVGDKLDIYKAGKVVKNPATGISIPLPASKVATIQINSLFGETELTEGAITSLISGSIDGIALTNLIVKEHTND